jgi:Na+-driven multidrug efflux pump
MSANEIATQDNAVWLSGRSRFRAAMLLAVVADGLQIILFPLFSEGALSPAEDVLDVAVALILGRLIGWHWEFLPTFLTELVPGADLVPFWTLAVANVYRKWKKGLQIADSVT